MHLTEALAVDPVVEAVFKEHGLSTSILSHLIVETTQQKIGLFVGSSQIHKSGQKLIVASLSEKEASAIEDTAELAHKIVHALLDSVSNNNLELFIIDQQLVDTFNKQLKHAIGQHGVLTAHRKYLPLYTLAFSEPKIARKYLERRLQLAKAQLHKLQFSDEQKDILNKIRMAAVEQNAQAYLVGGCLRDKLLGKDNHDLDFMVVTDDLKQFVSYMVKKYQLRDPVHLERSDAYTLRMGSVDVDLIEARKVYTPMRSFEETTLEGEEEFTIALDDAYRRDLTINALMYDLQKNEVLDPTKRGLKDLQEGVINSIIDPYVKYRINAPDMLRALRFAAVMNFKLGPEMLKAMRTNASRIKSRDKGGDISTRRIRRELRKAAESAQSWNRFKRLAADTGIIDYIAEDVEDVQKDREGKSPKDIKEK